MGVLDEKGDREPDFMVMDMNPISGEFEKMTEVFNTDDGGRVSFILTLVEYEYKLDTNRLKYLDPFLRQRTIKHLL